MPHEDDPKYATWSDAIEKEISTLESGAIVVGHSIGGTILINALAERAPAVNLGAIVLISAPFIGDGGWESDEIVPRADLGARLPKGVPVCSIMARATRPRRSRTWSCMRQPFPRRG